MGSGSWACRECRLGPGRGSLVDWLEGSRCSGDPLGRIRSEAGTHVLVPTQLTSLVCTRTKEVHSSHVCGMLHGLGWCWKCGHYGSVATEEGRLLLLTEPCLKICTPSGQNYLNRIKKGLPPKPGKPWPIPPRAEWEEVFGWEKGVANSFCKTGKKKTLK
eukprot:5542767-Pyramimonas_sp.AAC.1